MKVETLDRLEAVGAAAWRDLHAASHLRSPFLSFTWQREWARAFASTRRVEVRTVKDDTGAVRLTAAALDLLPGLDLAAIDPTGVTLLPAAGRYRAEIADVPRAHHGGQPGSDAQPGLFESDNPVSPLHDHSNEGPDDFRN